MQRTHTFLCDEVRYLFDFGECRTQNGWAQVDTRQDASYFGIWANPTTLQVIEFMEGDLYRSTMDSPEEFAEWLSNVPDFKGIDPGFNDELAETFRSLGLGHLLH